MRVGDAEYRGRALFDALDVEMHRVWREGDERGLDLFWYLWTGPVSPLFGKDRMTTFETYLVADKAAHKETKNPYFKLIHERDFCERVFADFGVDPQRGLIVNGHVPVKIEQGESPLKRDGAAVTIDGAFSEAYGDKGYTLVLRSGRTYLAQHHHFESIEEAIVSGADIVPEITEIRTFDKPRTVGDTETGESLRREIEVLELLVRAYRESRLVEQKT
jgi:fructose-1,6-bisphosphatase-3